MKRQMKRKLSVLLSAILVLSSINIGAVCGSEDDNTEKIIVGFEELEETYALQKLPAGAQEKDIKFPSAIWADMVIVKTDDEGQDRGIAQTTKNVPVSQDASGENSSPEEKTETETEIEDLEKEVWEEGKSVEESGKAGLQEEIEESEEAAGVIKEESEETAEEIKEESEEAAEEIKEEPIEATEEIKREHEEATEEVKEEIEEDLNKDGKQPDEEKTVNNPSKVEKEELNVAANRQQPASPSQPETSRENEKKTEGSTVRKKIKGIEWELNFAESSEPEFISGEAGVYVYDLVLPENYETDTSLSLPQIRVIVEEEKEGAVLTAEAGDYLVTVTAEAEVFPEGVSLSVKLIENEHTTESLKQAVEELEGITEAADKNLIYFDVEILDQDGNKVQPDNEKGNVTISFENLTEEIKQLKTQDYQIYHLNEESHTMERKNTEVTDQGVQAEMDQFSPVILAVNKNTKILKSVSVTTASELKDALMAVTDSVITVDSNITFAYTNELNKGIELGANHTLQIPDSSTLVITGKIDTYNSSTKMKKLTIQGSGTVRIEGEGSDCLKGNIDLGGQQSDNITISLETIKNSIRATTLNVNHGATVVVDSPKGSGLITVNGTRNETLNINSGGRIEINNFLSSGINCEGTINIGPGGEVFVNAAGTDDKAAGIILTKTTSKVKINGGSLNGTNGGGIYLTEGSKVEGMADLLSDQWKTFDSNSEVTVSAGDVTAADNQITEGLYYADFIGEKFIKTTTKLENNILTLSSNNGGNKDEGWNWSSSKKTLDLNDKFKNNKQIVFAPGIAPTIKLNGNVIITPDDGEAAITVFDNLTITAATEKGKLTASGKIKAQGSVTINGMASVAITANDSDAALYAKGEDSTITISGTAKVTAVNEGSGPAMNKAPETSGYTNPKITVSQSSSGKPIEEYKAEDINKYKYLSIEEKTGTEEPSIATKLENKVLTISSDNGGNKEEGWNWSSSKKTLDLNDKFKGNKQIVFAPGIAATIKLNGSVIITPDDGESAITAFNSMTITAATEKGKLTASGKMEVQGSITINGMASVAVTSNASEAALYAKGENSTITISGTAKVTAVNEGSGPAMNKAPETSGYTNPKITVSQSSSGKPIEEYKAEDIDKYKYFSIEENTGTEKPSTATKLENNILTISSENGGNKEEGWNWSSSKKILDLNDKFKGNKQILFAPGISPTIKLNGNVIITPDDGESAITAFDHLTITAATEKGKLTAGGKIGVQGSITINGMASVAITANDSDAALYAEGKGSTITISGTAKVTAVNKGSGPAMNKAPETSGYTNPKITVSQSTSGKPIEEYKAEDINEYKYLSIEKNAGTEKPSTATKLENNILTISSENGGNKEEGWNWSSSKKTLDLNDRFKGNKQILFAPGIAPTIRLNGNVIITPDDGEAAITAFDHLTITAATEKGKLTAGGKIEAQGSVTINGMASVIVTANHSDAALYAKGEDSTITISGTAKVTAVNEGSGPAMNKAPETSGYTNPKITVSQSSSGRPRAAYKAAEIKKYKYVRIDEKAVVGDLTTVNGIEDAMEKMDLEAPDIDIVDEVIKNIRNLTVEEQKSLKPETIKKVDQILQQETGIELVTKLDVPSEFKDYKNRNKQIQKIEISGAMLAAGITTTSPANTKVELKAVQKLPEKDTAVTVECTLSVNGKKGDLQCPVTLVLELPPEYIPIDGYQIHHVGNGIDEWLDFIYDEDTNSALFQTSSFSTFSIKEQSPGSHSNSSRGGGGGRGFSSTKAAPKGKWIQDVFGWWYQYPDKSYPKDGWYQLEYLEKSEWYYFDKNGYMATGWVFSNGNWFYLNTSSDGTNGKMLTGWQFIDGNWYYLNEASDGTRGARLMDTWVGEYYLNKEGIWEEGKNK